MAINVRRKIPGRAILSLLAGGALVANTALAGKHNDDDDDPGRKNIVEITFIHSGDFHGDYHPHTNARGDAAGSLEGGIARAVTVIDEIRKDE